MSASDVIQALKKLGNPKKAASSMWFFKTQKGQYGHGDIFIGVTVPEQRKVARAYKDLRLPEIQKLLRSKIHEHRLTGLIILANQYSKTDEKTRENIYNFYLENKKHVNNWDLVDTSASYIVGAHLLDKKRDVLYTLARSKNLWDRRIAIVATHWFIRRGDFADTIRISKMLLKDKHDLIHKAVGWMLREMGARSRPTLAKFLKANAALMPRTALRYAIEHFPQKERKAHLARR